MRTPRTGAAICRIRSITQQLDALGSRPCSEALERQQRVGPEAVSPAAAAPARQAETPRAQIQQMMRAWTETQGRALAELAHRAWRRRSRRSSWDMPAAAWAVSRSSRPGEKAAERARADARRSGAA
ncbi:MAG: hypothetical protein U5L11_10185 [Arhodomonas sp.]|nr:hypothetical protein [Arhodomonas sp.]